MLNHNAPLVCKLESFLDVTSPAGPAARMEAEKLLDFLTRRHTFAGRLGDHNRGLLFGVNALVVNPVTEAAYMQPHAKEGRMLPPGGKMEAADLDDIAATALRELHEEAPVFTDVVNIHHAMGNPLLLDVHFQRTPHQHNWWFFTVGFWVPPDFCAVWHGGEWQPLHGLLNGDDIANARSAQRVLNDLAGLRRWRGI